MWLAFSVRSLPHTTHQNQDILIVRSTLLVCMHSGKCVYVCLCTPWLFSDFSVAVTCIMTDGWHGMSFHVFIDHLYIFSSEMSAQILCQYLNWIIFYIALWESSACLRW